MDKKLKIKKIKIWPQSNKFLKVYETLFEGKDYRDSTYYIVQFSETAKTVLIFATTPDKKIILVSKIREAANENIFSLPGGRVEPGQTLKEAAGDELLGETGWHAHISNQQLGAGFYSNPARLKDRVFIFIAELSGKKGERTSQEGPENQQKYHEFPYSKILEMIESGKVDAVSVAGILLAKEKGLL